MLNSLCQPILSLIPADIRKEIALLFTPVSITTLIGTEDARFILNGISPIAKGDLKWRDALLVTGTVNSNAVFFYSSQ